MKKIDEIDQGLHEKFAECGKNARAWMRKCVMMLPEIERRRIWEKKGFSCIYEYAAKLAGMSRETVNEALRVMKKVETMPELFKVIERSGINRVKPVVAIATPETAEFWAKKAKIMSKHTLETYVREFRNGNVICLPGRAAEKGEVLSWVSGKLTKIESSETQKKIVAMELKPEVLAKLEKLKGKMGWNELMEQMLNEREERLEARKPVAMEAKNRHIPAAIKKHVFAKTNGQCAFPGCVKQAKILHHTERFAVGRRHDPEKIRPMCVAHERLAHLSLIANEERASEKWRVRREVERNSLAFVVDMEVGEYRRR